jgi:hypothetical protein
MVRIPGDLGQRIVEAARLAVALHLEAAAADIRNSDGGPRPAESGQAKSGTTSRSRRLFNAGRHGPVPGKTRPGPLSHRHHAIVPWLKGDAA